MDETENGSDFFKLLCFPALFITQSIRFYLATDGFVLKNATKVSPIQINKR